MLNALVMEAPGVRLARLLRERKAVILTRWEHEVRSHGIARKLDRPALLDSMPTLVDKLARAAETFVSDQSVELEAVEHAQQRLELGYDIGQLILEYGQLRLALIAELGDEAHRIPLSAWEPVTRALELGVSDVTQRFTRSRERKLLALERISTEAMQALDLDTMLDHIVTVLSEAIPEVDVVTILLREGEQLRVRATRGPREDVARRSAVPVGEGFAGTIAQTRAPLFLRDAGRDPLVESGAVRDLGLRALYGVPLLDGNGLIGVAYMGSKVAYDFQQEDLILFRGLANQATAVIASRRTIDDQRTVSVLREQFIGILGHDLRSPLNAVLGSAQSILRRGRVDEHDRRAVDRILRSSQRMGRLVADVLDFARTRLGAGIPMTFGWVDLVELTRLTCEEIEQANPGRAVRVEASMRSRVCCDADRIAQLLSNLVVNGIKHGRAGEPVMVTLSETDGHASIAVHNEGSPIAKELLPYVFDPFRIGESRVPRGLGLGLYIAKAIVDGHHGSIDVESGHSGGTTFTVTIPKSQKGAG